METFLTGVSGILVVLSTAVSFFVGQLFWQLIDFQILLFDKLNKNIYILVKSSFVALVVFSVTLPLIDPGGFGVLFSFIFVVIYIMEVNTFKGKL